MKSKTLLFFVAVILVISLLVSCAKTTTPTPKPVPTVTATATVTAPPTTATTTVTAPPTTVTATPAPAPTVTTTATVTAAPKPEPIVLRGVTILARTDPIMAAYDDFADTVNKRSNGALVIQYLGAGEVVPINQQLDALRTGLIDFNYNTMGLVQTVIKEATFMADTRLKPWEEHNSGWYDYLVELHKAINVRFIERAGEPLEPYLFSNKPISSLNDIKGQRIRPYAAMTKWVELLGAAPIVMNTADVYTALERGTVDGVTAEFSRIAAGDRWGEVVRSFVDIPFQKAGGMYFVMNLKKWDSLPKNLQDIVLQVAAERVKALYDVNAKNNLDLKNKAIASGVKPTQLPAADAEKFLGMAAESRWQTAAGMGIPQATVDKVKKMLGY